MAIINFSVPKTLEKRVAYVIKEKGFASKAEFFRFAAIYFMDVINKPLTNEEQRFNYLTNELKKEIVKRYSGTKLLSAREQLADL